MGYAVRGRCGQRIAIIRRAGEDADGDRDFVLGVRVLDCVIDTTTAIYIYVLLPVVHIGTTLLLT